MTTVRTKRIEFRKSSSISLFQYYWKPYGLVKELNNDGLIDSFIKIRELNQSKPVLITDESDLQFWGVHLTDIMILPSGFALILRRILDLKISEIYKSLFFYFQVTAISYFQFISY